MKPTEICFRLECRDENCRSKVIRDPLPKEFVREAWNPRVGYSMDNCFTHFACQVSLCLLTYFNSK